MKHNFLFSIRFCLLLFLALPDVAFSQTPKADSLPTFNQDLKELPRSQENKIFIKLKMNYRIDLSYTLENGFNDSIAGKHFADLFHFYKILKTETTFKRLKTPELSLIFTATFSDPTVKKALISALNKDVFVDYAEEIPVYYPFLIPNDYSVSQFYLHRINAFEAWDITTGSSLMRIAVLDDAFLLSHEDLQSKVWVNTAEIPSNGIDDDGNGYIDDVQGFDVSNNDPDAGLPAQQQASFQHGTFMAGIAAAATNNGLGIASLGYYNTFIPVKCKPDSLNNNSIPDGHLGLEYAIIVKPDVINLSWGGFQYSDVIQLLCNTARDSGILVVAAAGNTGTDDTIYPAANENVISVGATNLNDMVSSFSTYGVWLDVMAPGSFILSTHATGVDQYASVSGTSASCAIVSSLCTLLKSANPQMSTEELELCLKGGCWNINEGNPDKIGKMGSGRVDALGAVTCVESPPHCNCGGNGLFTCVGQPYQFQASSLGLNADTWYWTFAGGDPATSTLQNPTVVYNFPGIFTVMLVGCNSFGCDTLTTVILVGWPSASLSAVNTGKVCLGSAAYLEVFMNGTAPFGLQYTDGINIFSLENLPDQYKIPVFPTQNTTYSLVSMHDKFCDGTVSGTVTLNPVDCGPCSNTDYEFGNFSTWLGFLGYCCGSTSGVEGMSSNRQEIESGQIFDPYSFGTVPIVCPSGNSFSAKLGNWFVGAESEKLRKTFIVTPDNASFTYHYAVFLEDPPGHAQIKKPKFEVKILDSNNQLISDSCAHYLVIAGPATAGWLQNNLVRYKNWTTVGVDLSSYIGQQITIEFKTEDCGLKGHFGYAYVDANCGPMSIQVQSFCDTIDTITLVAPAGYANYQWHPTGDSTQSIQLIHPHPGDTITVTMTSVTGCHSTVFHVLQTMPHPSPTACCDTTICVQDTVVIEAHGAGPGGFFQWTSDPPGFTSADSVIHVNPLHTTKYSVAMENSNHCPADSLPIVTVTVNDSLSFSLGNDIEYCEGDTVILSVLNQGGLTYEWSSRPPGLSSDNDTVVVTPVDNVTYILTVANGGCNYTDSIVAREYVPYSDAPITHIPYCFGDTLITLSCPVVSTSYLWLSTPFTTSSISVTPHNWDIYQCAFITPNNCNDTIRFILDSVSNPDADAGADTFVCQGYGMQLMATGGQLPGSTYTWTSIPPGFNATGQEIMVFPNATTSYIVEVTNGPECTAPPSYDTVVVSVDETPLFEMPPDQAICAGDTIPLTISVPGGFNFWTSDPPGFLSTDTTVLLSPTETTIYYLTINTATCSFSNYFIVTVRTGLNLQPLQQRFCATQDSVKLTAPNGYHAYYWPQSGDSLPYLYVHPVNGNQYTVYLQNSTSNCMDTLTFSLLQSWGPSISISASDSALCHGLYVILEANPIPLATYTWSSVPAGLVSGQQIINIIPDTTTTYFCNVDSAGCLASSSVTIEVIQPPKFELGAPMEICGNEPFYLNPHIRAEQYLWSTGSADSLILVEQSGDYILKAWNRGCSASDTIEITFLSAAFRCPNVFTPNDDGKNDRFEIIIDDVQNFHLKIFNRWGEVVYECDNIEDQWDGKIKGKQASDGVYYYVCRYWSECQSKNVQETGSVSLYR